MKRFIPLSQALVELGISDRRRIYRLIRHGVAKEGIHYQDRALPNAQRSEYWVNPDRIQELWSVPRAKRHCKRSNSA